MSHTWGPPPPYSSNVHVNCHMWHMWAKHEGSPPPYSSNMHVYCHTWHMWHMLATCEGSPPPYSSNVHDNCHMWHTWATCEGSPPPYSSLPHVSCTWLTCMHTAPLRLPKKVTEKPYVNHIGSSTSHQLRGLSATESFQSFSSNREVVNSASHDLMSWYKQMVQTLHKNRKSCKNSKNY